MLGLLYKDFLAIKGKLYIWCLMAMIGIIFVYRMLVTGQENDMLIMALVFLMIQVMYLIMVGKIDTSIVEVDEGKKQKQYFISIPISKKKYVASKYIMVLIGFYIITSISMVLLSISKVGCTNKMCLDAIEQMLSALGILACIFLWIPTIELPFLIGFGANKGKQIKTGIIVGIFFLCLIYFLFGDVTVFDKIDLISLLNYLKKHKGVLLILQVLIPYITFALYYVSYRIALLLYDRREWDNE